MPQPRKTAFLRIVGYCIFSTVISLSGCSSLTPSTTSAPQSSLPIAYVVTGENGNAWARAIVSALPDAGCPSISVDGNARPMTIRVPAATIAQRPTASDVAFSKPSAFPVLTCEFLLPDKTTRAAVGGIELPIPKANPRRIIVIGDSGCRMKQADNAWQDCNDRNAWPFRAVADAAAKMAPDLVIHVGDYHYRENACPANVAGCQGSPWGYGWDTWDADLFAPAAKLLAAAPWVFTRGNHEECRRAGQGWFRFLDPRPFVLERSCDDAKDDLTGNFTAPYPVPIASDLQLIVFDSAVAGFAPLDPAKPRDAYAFSQFRQQFSKVDELANKQGVNSIFINHHPILAYATYDRLAVNGGTKSLLSVMNTLHPQAYYPSSVNLALHGHIHLFQAINFSSNHPATIVSGMAGNALYYPLPDPFPTNIGPAAGVTLDSITHSDQFGFVLMDKRENDWQISAYDHEGLIKTTCILTGSKLRCDKTGLLK